MSNYYRLHCRTHDTTYDGESINHGDDVQLAMIGIARALAPWRDSPSGQVEAWNTTIQVGPYYVPLGWLWEHEHCDVVSRPTHGPDAEVAPPTPESERRARAIEHHFVEVDRLLRGYFGPLILAAKEVSSYEQDGSEPAP